MDAKEYERQLREPVQGTTTRPVPTAIPQQKSVAPIQSPVQQSNYGVAGKIFDVGKKWNQALSIAPKIISTPYSALKSTTGTALKTLNKFFIEPVDRFAAGAVKAGQDAQANRGKVNPLQSAYENSPINYAARGVKNVVTGENGTFGNGTDVTGGLLPDKSLVSPEQVDKFMSKYDPMYKAKQWLWGKDTNAQLTSAFSNPSFATNLAASIATPGIPAAKLLKAGSKIPLVAKTLDKVGDVIKGSDKLTRIAEAVKPGSVLPDFQKILESSQFQTKVRQSTLYRKLQETVEGMSEGEKKMVGQLMEGGVVSGVNKRTSELKNIATEMNKISDEIGKELVDRGVISAESFAQYKGKYLTHISTEVFKKLEDSGIPLPKELGGKTILSKMTTPFSKKRTGDLTDYERNFAIVMMHGLGSEIGTSEANKAIEDIIGVYGKKVGGTTPLSNPVSQALNELLQEGSQKARRIASLAEGSQGYRTPEQLSSELLDVFKQKMAARVPGTKFGAGVSGVVGDVTGGEEKVLSQLTDVPSTGGEIGKAFTQTSEGFTKPVSGIGVGNLQVGELPQKIEIPQIKLGQKVLQTIPEGHVLVSELKGLPSVYQTKYAGVSIPKIIADKITQQFYTAPGGLEKKLNFLLDTWKQFKTTLAGTPAYFARNQNSNIVQISIETGDNIAQAAAKNYQSMGELSGVGKESPFLNEFLVVSDAQPLSKKVTSLMTGKTNSFNLKSILNPREFQNWQESAAKFTIYKHYRDLGMDMQNAWKKANIAIFSPANISLTEKGYAKYLIPFYNWQRQEIPYFLKTYAEHPERYAAYTRTRSAVEGLSPEPTVELPDYMEGQWRLPSTDEQGNRQYLDLSYHMPFGTFTRKAGENDLPLGFNINPLFYDAGMISKGLNPQYGTPLTKSLDEGEQNAAKTKTALETFGPNVIREIGNLKSAVKGETEKYTNRKRTVGQWVLRQLGTKITSLSPEKQNTIDSIESATAKKNVSSRKYTLLDELQRGVITRAEYDEKIKKEEKALLDIQLGRK